MPSLSQLPDFVVIIDTLGGFTSAAKSVFVLFLTVLAFVKKTL
jgi:hypothetical protein